MKTWFYPYRGQTDIAPNCETTSSFWNLSGVSPEQKQIPKLRADRLSRCVFDKPDTATDTLSTARILSRQHWMLPVKSNVYIGAYISEHSPWNQKVAGCACPSARHRASHFISDAEIIQSHSKGLCSHAEPDIIPLLWKSQTQRIRHCRNTFLLWGPYYARYRANMQNLYFRDSSGIVYKII